MRQIHIFMTYFDDFRKLRFLCMPETEVGDIVSWKGVFRILWVHGPSQESASTLFWALGRSFGAAKARTMTIFEGNPGLELKVLFFDF